MTATAKCEVPGCDKISDRFIFEKWICTDHEIKFEDKPSDPILSKTEIEMAKLKGLATSRAKVQDGHRVKIELDGKVEFDDVVPYSLNRICKNLEKSGQVPQGLGFKLRRFGKVIVEYPSGQKRTFTVEKV